MGAESREARRTVLLEIAGMEARMDGVFVRWGVSALMPHA